MPDQPLTPAFVDRTRSALKIAGLYLVMGGLWHLFFDQLIAAVAGDPAMLTTLSILKGWGYVVVTALLLYWLIRRHAAALRDGEERLRQITDAMPALISYIGTDRRYRFNNRAYEEWFGHTPGEVQCKPVEQVLGAAAYQSIAEYVEAALGGQVVTFEAEVPYRDGGTRFVHAAYIPDFGVDRQVNGFFALVSDITERKRADEALRESQQRLRAIIDNAKGIVWVKDLDGRFLILNRYVEGVLGRPLEQLVGRTVFDIFPPNLAEEYARNDRQVLEAGRSMEFEESIMLGDERHTCVSVKFPLRDSNGRIYALGAICTDITERIHAEEALRESEERFRTLVEEAPDSIFIRSGEKFAYVNRAGLRLFGAAFERQLLGQSVLERLHPDSRLHALQRMQTIDHERRPTPLEEEVILQLDGTPVPVEVSAIPFTFRGEHSALVFLRDITQRKRAEEAHAQLEEQLRQSQKMESIGGLAGGVAHDFNNLLTVIQGHCNLLQDHMSAADPLRKHVEHIQRAGQRAASLTRQLLAFSRKQMLAPLVLDLNSLVADLHQMLERLIGEDIRLTTVLQSGLWPITADPGQIEQVIMNLAVNARDAMPTGGILTIETRNVHLDESYARTHLEAPMGPCVLLAVSDTGHGMDEATRSRIFEPFFTTKEPGRGTGLGLSTVYGIVKQSGGDITVYSEPGQGTVFKIHLPACEGAAISLPATHTQPALRRGRETVLLVEDEGMVRDLVRTVLGGAGYVVLEAPHGEAALSLSAQHQGQIDLLVTDVVMPHMGGRELAERLKALRPQMKVLFMSGYTDDTVVRHGVLAAEAEFLPKPFSPRVLASKVRELLDRV